MAGAHPGVDQRPADRTHRLHGQQRRDCHLAGQAQAHRGETDVERPAHHEQAGEHPDDDHRPEGPVMAQHLPELGDVLAEGGDGLRRLAAGQLPQEQRRHHRDDEEHAGDAEQQRVILREARPALAQDQPDQRGHAEHDHPGDGRHEAEQAGAAAVVQAAADQVHPGHADQPVAQRRQRVEDQERRQDQPRSLWAEQHDHPAEEEDHRAHQDIRPHEPPFLALHAHQPPRHQKLRQQPADLKHLAGDGDENLRVGELAHEVRDDRRRADQVERDGKDRIIGQQQDEVMLVDALALLRCKGRVFSNGRW